MTNMSLLEKIAKLQAMATGAAAVGNQAESEAFASKVAELLARHKLTMSDVEVAAQEAEDPMGVEKVAPHGEVKQRRIAWQEKLAQYVAGAFFCKIFVHRGNDRIGFVGRETDRKMAVWVFTNLVRQATTQADREYQKFFDKSQRMGEVWRARGFRASYLTGFVVAIGLRYAADRARLKAESQHALVRVNQALAQTEQFMKQTMSLGKSKALATTGRNQDGFAAGQKAGANANIRANAVNGAGESARQLKA